MEVGLGPGHIVVDGYSAPPHQKRETTPNFRSMSVVAKRLDGLRCHLVPRPRRHCVRWSPRMPQRGGTIWPTCCGQTAAWIKVPLGTGVGLGPGDIVLHEDPAPPLKKDTPPPLPVFGSCLLWPNGWMDQDATR